MSRGGATRTILLAVAIGLGLAAVHTQQTAAPPGANPDALSAGPKALPIPPGRQVFYDTNQMPWQQLGSGSRRKTVLGENVTFSLAELDPEASKGRPTAPGHHHAYEQVLFGLEGVYDQTAGPETCRIGRLTACLEPPNVQHSVSGFPTGEKVLTIEVVPLARKDLVPPRPTITYPASPEAKPIPDGMKVFADFNKMPLIGAPSEAQMQALIGETCSVTLWRLHARFLRGTSAAGHHHTAEQINYVIEGHAEARVGDQIRRVGPGMLIMIPSDVEHLPLTAIGNEDVLLFEFQPGVRRDILTRMGKQ